MIRAIDPQPDDHFLEIGPGRGALTRPLSSARRRVLAFEIDRDLAAGLREPTNAQADASSKATSSKTADSLAGAPVARRSASPATFPTTSRRRFSSSCSSCMPSGVPLVDATLMLQREVADRLVAAPGGQGIRRPQRPRAAHRRRRAAPGAAARRVPAAPRRSVPRWSASDSGTRGLPARRSAHVRGPGSGHLHAAAKTLANALLAFRLSSRLPPAAALERAGIDGRRRPETLTIAELVRLADVFVVRTFRVRVLSCVR